MEGIRRLGRGTLRTSRMGLGQKAEEIFRDSAYVLSVLSFFFRACSGETIVVRAL